MEREELEELTECWDCGATVSPSEDPVYEFAENQALCFECALRRGGEYDAHEERWTVAPNVQDLPDEQRPHG
jgi:hypothetical protein